MDYNSTFNELQQFSRNEKKLIENIMVQHEVPTPKAKTVETILAFSKACTIKKSKHLKHLEIVLN